MRSLRTRRLANRYYGNPTNRHFVDNQACADERLVLAVSVLCDGHISTRTGQSIVEYPLLTEFAT
ncbi:hypothetical protein SAMN05443245_7584 [Paraburkholderia fungorum]|uniref:Uncharacterized protein n=1 Tax=Paraburkholderia fungorum TaxID=134537 RepID=A0A1H1JZ62_9BURK|nr:hypothetical protein SAMN05443245_7584 [Paraburkholderia fungorum]